MKKLLSLLALAALLPVSANADVLKNVNLKGDIQTIASDVNHNNNAVLPYNSGTSVRVLAGLSADLVEDVTANLTFQYANLWGGDDAAGRNVQDYWNNVRLVEANVVLHNLFCCLEATVGRQFYGDEDSAVMYIGPNHYNAEFNGLTNSLDAAKVTYADDVKAFTVLAGKVNNTTGAFGATNPAVVPAVANQFEIFGADLKLNLTDTFKAQVYGYDVRDADEDVTDKHTGIYGAKLTFNPEAFLLSAEYARNFAGDKLVREHNDTGHMIKVDIAADIKTITARGAFFYANENFAAIGNYTPGLLIGHRLGGQIYEYSADGVALFNLGFDVKPADKWTVSLDGFTFQDHRMDHSATLEADLTVKYAHNEYVELFAGAGYAKYTGAADVAVFNKANFAKDNVKGQLGMLIKF
jgi:hypothetical protein